jgi:hypothetical protein
MEAVVVAQCLLKSWHYDITTSAVLTTKCSLSSNSSVIYTINDHHVTKSSAFSSPKYRNHLVQTVVWVHSYSNLYMCR